MSIRLSNVNTTAAFTAGTATPAEVDLDFEVDSITELFVAKPLAYTTATSATIQAIKLNKVTTTITASGDFTFTAPKTLAIASETVAIDPADIFVVDCPAPRGCVPKP